MGITPGRGTLSAGLSAAGAVADAPGGSPGGVLPAPLTRSGRWPGRDREHGRPRPPVSGWVALGALVAGCVAVAVFAAGAPSPLVSGSSKAFPPWLAGPFHGIARALIRDVAGPRGVAGRTVGDGFSALLAGMLVAYLIVLARARTFSGATIAIAVAAMYAVMVLGPPIGLSDVFNYLGYARLGTLHGLNPYTHVVADERHDPVYALVSWRHLASPYGEAFTLLTFPLGLLSLPVAFWVFKLAVLAADLGLVWMVWRCARRIGRDPRPAVLLVALNPLVLIYEVGGVHNDAFMLIPTVAAISLLLAGRHRSAGAALVVAVAVKLTVVVVLPFLVIGARAERGARQVLLGALPAAIALAAVSVAVFGLTAPDLADQSTIVTPYSVLNLVGVLTGLGGASPAVEHLGKLAFAAIVVALAARAATRPRADWTAAAGWATLALLASTAWLMPWYVIWAPPLAGLSASVALRRATLAFTVFAALTFMPVTPSALRASGVNTIGSPADRAATAQLARLQH